MLRTVCRQKIAKTIFYHNIPDMISFYHKQPHPQHALLPNIEGGGGSLAFSLPLPLPLHPRRPQQHQSFAHLARASCSTTRVDRLRCD
jgi:hypothetical protein